MFHDYYETSTKHKECKRVFLSMSQYSEQLEIDIEKALLEQQRGGVSVERVQEIMNNSLDAKYRV